MVDATCPQRTIRRGSHEPQLHVGHRRISTEKRYDTHRTDSPDRHTGLGLPHDGKRRLKILKSRRRLSREASRDSFSDLDSIGRRRGDLQLSRDVIVSRFSETGQARDLFRRSARKILNGIKSIEELKRRNKNLEEELKSFVDMAREIEDMTEMKHIQAQSGLTFDLRHFRARREADLTSDVKHILTLPPDARTPEMIRKVVVGLQQVRTYSEYPEHMQKKLAHVAWYQECAPKRLIIKQGHYPENFYFVLTGQAQVKKVSRDKSGGVGMMVIARLTSGQSFGELALIHRTKRLASVESVTHMKLLVISRDDFMDIFFDAKALHEPEHLQFLRKNIDVLQSWPVELLKENPMHCMFHFFRRGLVVAADSSQSEWIYIVKSGSCAVLKNLQAVAPRKPCRTRPCLKIGSANEPGENREPESKTDSGLPKIRRPSMSSEMRDIIASLETEETDVEDSTLVLPALKTTNESEADLTSSKIPSVRPHTVAETIHVKNADGTTGRKSYLRSGTSQSEHAQCDGIGQSKSKFNFLPKLKKKKSTLQRYMGFGNRGEVKAPLVKEQTELCCVQLRILRPKDVFGLEDIRFEEEHYSFREQTSVTLVSNGAELIMLSRAFFVKHATERVRKYIRETVRPYPSEETLENNLQNYVDWGKFRKELVKDLLDYFKETKDVSTIVV